MHIYMYDIYTLTCIVVVLYDGPTTPTRVAFFGFTASEACRELQICSLLASVPRTKFRHCSKAVFTVPQSSRISIPSVMLGRRLVLLFTLLREKASFQFTGKNKLELTLGAVCRGFVASLLSRSSPDPSSGPGRGHYVVFLGKTLNSHSASLHPGV